MLSINTGINIQDLFTVQNLLSLGIFLILTFVGVAGRVSIDIEIYKKKLRDIGFFHRYFIATVLSYVIEFFIIERPTLRRYYSEIIIIFCIFVNDIIVLVFSNKKRLFIYILNIVTKGFIDLKDTINKDNKNDTSA